MTNIGTEHPGHIPYIEITEKGRKIAFRKECLAEIEIYRQVNENEPQLLIKNVRTPFIDQQGYPAGTQLSYTIKLLEGEEEKTYELKARL